MHKRHFNTSERQLTYDFSVKLSYACVATLTVAYVDIYLCVRVTNPALCKFYDK